MMNNVVVVIIIEINHILLSVHHLRLSVGVVHDRFCGNIVHILARTSGFTWLTDNQHFRSLTCIIMSSTLIVCICVLTEQLPSVCLCMVIYIYLCTTVLRLTCIKKRCFLGTFPSLSPNFHCINLYKASYFSTIFLHLSL